MKKYIIIGVLMILWYGSQVLFEILYSNQETSYLGIPGGHWTSHLITSGYKQQQTTILTTPYQYTYSPSHMAEFQSQCETNYHHCIGFFGHTMYASYLWISAIQQIAQSLEFNVITDFSHHFAQVYDHIPHWYKPYHTLQFLALDQHHTETNKSQAHKSFWDNVIKLGEQGITYHCDQEKLSLIKHLTTEEFMKIVQQYPEPYRDPCTDHELPQILAFNHYKLGNFEQAIFYYKVAAFHHSAPRITAMMPAILNSKQGDHKTSSYLRYTLLLAEIQRGEKNLNPDEMERRDETINKSKQKVVSEYLLYLLNASNENELHSG